MSSIVSVVFDRTREYEIFAHGTLSREEASRWLDAQWVEMECETSNPVGKVLMLDRILGVARYGGEERFAKPGDWARQYAEAVIAVLERPAVRIDIADHVVG
jgi:hypothetical protein